eukprot:CAMPEP_0175768052 /NCGR_PEP_ID=MMETSP0097-20121207/70230_1 /TAXON_ID=311494 /ORGANISM="Alexandrium monilatum, Strain CCMP3105" /LENGTH=494 /DNA_ID=CAMNT_0017078153 /DNA_START=1 /DNA_END=1485 /DNA_ORIENTATION=-
MSRQGSSKPGPWPIGAAAPLEQPSGKRSSRSSRGAVGAVGAGAAGAQDPPTGPVAPAATQQAAPPGHYCTHRPDVCKKRVARKMLSQLDDKSLWHLAWELQKRGLLRVGASGFEVIKPAAQASAAVAPVPTPPVAVTPVSPDVSRVAAPTGFAPAAPPDECKDDRAEWSFASSERDSSPAPPGGDSRATRKLDGATAEQPTNESRPDDGSFTTLILRNLPPSFDQKAVHEWIDDLGYCNLYDFLLWFPAKKTSRLSTASYAFINFRMGADAQRFRQDHHLKRFDNSEGENGKKQLNVAIAKVQGFAENYVRFHHLCDDNCPTVCQPYFAQDSCDKLPQQTLIAAETLTLTAPQLPGTLESGFTTLVIRNLPHSVDNQDVAMQWLDGAGFQGQYDFFLYLPPKRRRPEQDAPGGPPQGLGYAFVNMRDPIHAAACVESLNGTPLAVGDPTLSIVPSKVQGLQKCVSHFGSLDDGGRLRPWTDTSSDGTRSPMQFQ